MARSLLLLPALCLASPVASQQCRWQAAWGTAEMNPAPENAAQVKGRAVTLRQVIRTSIGGARVRVRLSNALGRTPLIVDAASVARPVGNAAARLAPGSARPLSFNGAQGIVIPAGAEWLSDAVTLPVAALDDVAVTLRVTLDPRPDGQSSHPGSRATSYIAADPDVAAIDLRDATKVDHWFQLSGLEVERCGQAARRPGIVVLGDSITDGYGVAANTNQRWTDALARRLGGRIAVINKGLSGNRMLLDGLGPNALARLDRDVFGLPGVGHLIVLEGVNDLGMLTRDAPASPAQHRALVAQITGAYAVIVARARAHGVRAHGVTILPYMGSAYYHPDAANEADRQAINAWIRTPGNFDSVIDLDAVMRDPARPTYLKRAYDSGDGLHPSMAGYRAMAEAISLDRFR